jgi:hypothetical protein
MIEWVEGRFEGERHTHLRGFFRLTRCGGGFPFSSVTRSGAKCIVVDTDFSTEAVLVGK